MSTAKDFVGKEAIHDSYGRVTVTDRPRGARSIVNIRVLQRGPGWDDLTETYKKYRDITFWSPDGRTLRWGFTQRDEYGIKDQVHISKLKLIEA